MTTRKSSPDLPRGIEALLGSFPIPERDWEASAKAIQARIQAGNIDFDAALLEAPLPPEVGEESRTSGINPNPKGQSLADLARASVAKRRDKQDSAEIAKESFTIASQARSQTQEIAERVRKARDRDPSRPDATPVGPREPLAVAAAPIKTTEAAPPALPTTSKPANDSKRGMLIGAGATVLAIAAAIAIWMRTDAEQTVAQTVAKPVATSPRLVEATAKPAPAPEPVIAPDIAPRGGSKQNEAKPGAPILGDRNYYSEPSTQSSHVAAKPKSAAPGARPASGAAATEESRRSGELPNDPAMSPALGAAGGIPQKPSTGAVQAALGAVMSGARGCVAGQDEPSAADVVFGSDGKVQSVVVSGPAAGTPAAGCIETRLKKARVQPFAASTFSVRATIRPE